MIELEDRVRILERQVRRYRILNLALGVIVLAWFGFAAWNLMHLEENMAKQIGPQLRRWNLGMLQATGLEILDEAESRPVVVMRSADGGGLIEVRDRNGRATTGFDGNRGFVVRFADGTTFPESRAPESSPTEPSKPR